MQYEGLDSARRCAILFDNSKYNKPFADAVGTGFQLVDNGSLDGKVGESGIHGSDFFSAQAEWAKTCPEQSSRVLNGFGGLGGGWAMGK